MPATPNRDKGCLQARAEGCIRSASRVRADHRRQITAIDYKITLPGFTPNAVERHQVHAASSVYTTLRLHHRWLMDAVNTGTYPEFMEVNTEGMVTGYTKDKDYREPAPAMFNLIVTPNGTVELYNNALGIGMYTDSSTNSHFGNTTFYYKSTVVAVGSDNSGPWFKLKVGKLKVDYNC